ncbi:tyrosinase family oxidase copper chaperone [Longispora urticae]
MNDSPNTKPVSRRRALGIAVASAGVLGVSAFVGVQGAHPGVALAGAPEGTEFDETYQGRRITATAVAGPEGEGHHHGTVDVRIDGQPLHVMHNSDDTYTSSVNHYESHRTVREATYRAVDTLGDGSPVGNYQ